ncbi:MAG: hypothetical protein KXJ50_01895 [Vulcanococcus sp.]|jgi:hypothetical protein|uniref:hypothetical protein n=1 Tax=Vulcanococcus sp. TaxID=2856995 RepID=UPI0025D42481|nr:hypothetical protein [Vulcanococcus sp.]MBW0173509.1 hypothetical protein [Vulcanococcus sp.]MBW0179806.1 hypothetical protein [Vulcanococcus sp.]
MRRLSRAGAVCAAMAASIAAGPALLTNNAQAIDLKNFIPKSVFVKQANPTSVAILSIQGTTNTSQGVLCDVTYTSQALYPNVTTSKARCGSSRSQLFLGSSDGEVDYDASMVNLLQLYGISTQTTTNTNGATFLCAKPSGVRPSEFSYTLQTTNVPMTGMLLTTANPKQCWGQS